MHTASEGEREEFEQKLAKIAKKISLPCNDGGQEMFRDLCRRGTRANTNRETGFVKKIRDWFVDFLLNRKNRCGIFVWGMPRTKMPQHLRFSCPGLG
jgi:hypothetical protein